MKRHIRMTAEIETVESWDKSERRGTIKNCKVYPLMIEEQKELDKFL